jgi:hypothetical protein
MSVTNVSINNKVKMGKGRRAIKKKRIKFYFLSVENINS